MGAALGEGVGVGIAAHQPATATQAPLDFVQAYPLGIQSTYLLVLPPAAFPGGLALHALSPRPRWWEEIAQRR
jgi:hypothetical protein